MQPTHARPSGSCSSRPRCPRNCRSSLNWSAGSRCGGSRLSWGRAGPPPVPPPKSRVRLRSALSAGGQRPSVRNQPMCGELALRFLQRDVRRRQSQIRTPQVVVLQLRALVTNKPEQLFVAIVETLAVTGFDGRLTVVVELV